MSLAQQLGLPLGWSEHIAPTGHVYYYNTATRESTYVRPLVPTLRGTRQEKPLFKAHIPATDWLRVKTTEGNVFYSHKVRKESVWIAPDEIKAALEQLEQVEYQLSKVKKEQGVENGAPEKAKRKAEEPIPVDEVVITKKSRTDAGLSDEDDEEDTSEEDEDEDWQLEAAEQLAKEADELKRKGEEQRHIEEMEAEQDSNKGQATGSDQQTQREQHEPTIELPKVILSTEEAKALFKTLLREKDVNPLLPWDKSLPIFVSDQRYILLPSVTARREAFDEYCRERIRESKQSNIRKEKETLDPREEFEKLLTEEVKSTRTSWTDFRRVWKKDRRFYGWGRDDREREKRFREYVKDLGEKKRAAAEKAEVDFISLLKERVKPEDGLAWKDVKRGLYDDSRYDAVGSSSLREELFNTFMKGKAKHISAPTTGQEKILAKGDEPTEDGRRKRKEQALREREEKVRTERNRLDVQIERSKQGLGREESERQFRMLLTDAIRDPQTWEAALPQLKTDPRFANSPLTMNHQLQMFHAHIAHLSARHVNGLHILFESHSPSLATSFTDLPVSSLLSSLPSMKLGYDITNLEREYLKWQRERSQQCRKAFDEMLAENAFVEFWGRLGKIGGEGIDGGVKAEDMGEGEGEGGGGTVDMKVLAKNTDIDDMVKVIKNDKRYTMFDHMPEQRERWIRDYIAQLSAPKLSVHSGIS